MFNRDVDDESHGIILESCYVHRCPTEKAMTLLKVLSSLVKVVTLLKVVTSFLKVVTPLSYRNDHVSSRENIAKEDAGYCKVRRHQ